MVNSIMDIVEKSWRVETGKKIAAFEDKHGPMADQW
jgi:hypothetical protein